MPEGPETRRMADSISTALIDKKIIRFSFFHEQLDSLKALSKISVFDALSKGKAIIIRINGGLSIIIHNQLYGKWTFNRPDTQMKQIGSLELNLLQKKKLSGYGLQPISFYVILKMSICTPTLIK